MKSVRFTCVSQAEYYYWAFPIDYYKQQKSVDCNQVSLGSIQI